MICRFVVRWVEVHRDLSKATGYEATKAVMDRSSRASTSSDTECKVILTAAPPRNSILAVQSINRMLFPFAGDFNLQAIDMYDGNDIQVWSGGRAVWRLVGRLVGRCDKVVPESSTSSLASVFTCEQAVC